MSEIIRILFIGFRTEIPKSESDEFMENVDFVLMNSHLLLQIIHSSSRKFYKEFEGSIVSNTPELKKFLMPQ